ncbi:MAG: flagellar type III secretion system pore protein FliP [Nitrospinaceae bacterium]|nr:flagellar type III secretion system pore protein FliP [Nitrospinaceae bacterium]NIR54996.1 flagellar type III secretion system pore protein FliP [Nitrospinaceae bacterium]NIT82236.1 flagellar type III secretion system pore protein FliP [Nitrospinaceae bacterium]NIX34621.1 flagellar type III secretion system pore protein FliP [Nitrospinaceae bacterium]NIY15453.1 flagellar type III secretion system pore protein FliP [Nitrospinaceae bacterium]
MKKTVLLIMAGIVLTVAGGLWGPPEAMAIPVPTIQLGVEEAGEPDNLSTALQILFLLTILTLAPSILILMTSFSRIVIVLSFLRQAMGTQQTPPTQVLIGLALFLTFFVMSPVLSEINDHALQPYLNEEITQQKALDVAQAPIKTFMLKQTREKDLALFVNMGDGVKPETAEEVKMQAVVPAFIISELKTAFQIGFMIYIPFLILDMVVASILLSMGMMMLPPVLISLPFKLMLFVMVDGWHLTVGSLVKSFT